MKPVARKEDLVIQEVGGEFLVYDLRTNKAVCLNQTSALVWQNCNGEKNALDIAQTMEKELGSSVNEDFVWFAIQQLEKENLLEANETYQNKFEGLSRREVVRRLGIASMLAIPVVASIVAPTAAQTISCPPAGTGMADIPAGSGCPCIQPQDCSGGSCMNTSMTC